MSAWRDGLAVGAARSDSFPDPINRVTTNANRVTTSACSDRQQVGPYNAPAMASEPTLKVGWDEHREPHELSFRNVGLADHEYAVPVVPHYLYF